MTKPSPSATTATRRSLRYTFCETFSVRKQERPGITLSSHGNFTQPSLSPLTWVMAGLLWNAMAICCLPFSLLLIRRKETGTTGEGLFLGGGKAQMPTSIFCAS